MNTKHILIALLIVPVLFSSDLFEISLQTSSYRGMEEDYTYTEIYLSYARNDISFQQLEDGSHKGAIHINLTVLDSEGVTVDTLTILRDVYLKPGVSPSLPFHLIELYPFLLQPGQYQAVVIITDANKTGRQMSKRLGFTVDDYSKEKPKLSGLYLIGAVGQPDSTLFTRYNIKMLPYPRAVYSPYLPMMKLTYELYDFDDTRLFLGIADASGHMIRNYYELNVPDEGVAFNEMNVAGLYEGDYNVMVKLTDQKGRDIDVKKQNFSVVKQRSAFEDSLTIAELELITEMMHFLLPTAEERAFDALNPQVKFEYWQNYWERHDTTEGQMIKMHFLKNWGHASAAFETGQGRRDGHKTDMGRVYITYGPPDYVERHPFTSETNPWEKWIYTEGSINGEFIFGDQQNIGNMRLMSSTVMGEREDPNWMQKLSRQRREN